MDSHLRLLLVQKKSVFVYPKEEVMRVQHRHNSFVLQDASLLCFLSYHAVPWRFTTTTGNSTDEEVSCPFTYIFGIGRSSSSSSKSEFSWARAALWK